MKMLVKSLFWYTLCLIAVLHVYSNSVIITMQQSKSTYIIANFIELTKNVQWVLLMAIIPTDFKKQCFTYTDLWSIEMSFCWFIEVST